MRSLPSELTDQINDIVSARSRGCSIGRWSARAFRCDEIIIGLFHANSPAGRMDAPPTAVVGRNLGSSVCNGGLWAERGMLDPLSGAPALKIRAAAKPRAAEAARNMPGL